MWLSNAESDGPVPKQNVKESELILAKLSTIEIAAKQRHLYLLGKVKENKTLSRAELDELKRYERRTAGKITAKTKMTSKVQPKKKKRKAATPPLSCENKRGGVKKKAGKKKAQKKRKARLPVDEAEVRRLGLECENLTEADAAIRTRRSLAEIFRKHPQLRQAWDRGRFLRNLRDLTRAGISVSRAAKNLGLANGQVLRTMIDEDVEVGDLWKQTRVEVEIEVHSPLLEAAKEGNPAAIRAVENFLLDEKERPQFDPSRITKSQLVEITGKTPRTITRWLDKFDLPRNADKKTFDLNIVWAWYEQFLLRKAPEGKGTAVVLDPLKAMKAENLKMEIARKRHGLLDRSGVIVGQIAWVQNIKYFCERNVEEIFRLCSNQPREKTAEIARGFLRDLYTEAAKFPKELCLSAAKERELIEFLQSLKPYDGKEETTNET